MTDAIDIMDTTSADNDAPDLIAQAEALREVMQARLAAHEREAARLRTALGMDTPARSPPSGKRPRPGTLQASVYSFLQRHPGASFQEVQKALRLKRMPAASCLHTMSRRNGSIRVDGRRGRFRYFVVDAA